MVRKRRDFMCPLNRVFGIFGLSHNFWVVAVQDKASNTTKDANAPQLLLIGLHFGYTLATHIFPTPHAHFCYTFTTHLVITNAPHLLHFAYTFATLICHTLATHFLDLSQTLTTPFGNQKCATFVTLWLHSVFPHHMYTFATLSFPHFDCTFGSPKMRHICHTLATLSIPTPHVHFCYTFLYHTLTTPFGNQKCVTFITLWLHFAFPHCDYTFGSPKMRHICYTLATLCFPTPHLHLCYTFATLFFPTLSLHHLLIKNAPHLLHFGYTLLSHTFITPFANQKCATFVTLWLHFPFPHHMYTFATLSFPHSDYTIC